MLKYLVLSLPRCGSSALMRAAAICFGAGSFLREPFNVDEDVRYLPVSLRALTIEERLAVLSSSTSTTLGLKHIHSPFAAAALRERTARIIEAVLKLPGIRVILLHRENVMAEICSMEIAMQTGDWWSYGPAALPASVAPIAGGSGRRFTPAQIESRAATLRQSVLELRATLGRLGVDFIERSYEELFDDEIEAVVENVRGALAHFDAGRVAQLDLPRLRADLAKGRRFEASAATREALLKASGLPVS
jgi:LPS sulfotransferase NodH